MEKTTAIGRFLKTVWFHATNLIVALDKNLVVFWEGYEEHDRCDILEAVDPLPSLRALSSDVHHPIMRPLLRIVKNESWKATKFYVLHSQYNGATRSPSVTTPSILYSITTNRRYILYIVSICAIVPIQRRPLFYTNFPFSNDFSKVDVKQRLVNRCILQCSTKESYQMFPIQLIIWIKFSANKPIQPPLRRRKSMAKEQYSLQNHYCKGQ